MAEPLFLVDLSEDSRDYRHLALEPGVPLLDRQGVNYQILTKWLGDYIAEPEWRNEDTVAFYMSEEERGRLEDVDCQPASKADLEKTFAEADRTFVGTFELTDPPAPREAKKTK